jgi:hypothetical protein
VSSAGLAICIVTNCTRHSRMDAVTIADLRSAKGPMRALPDYH